MSSESVSRHSRASQIVFGEQDIAVFRELVSLTMSVRSTTSLSTGQTYCCFIRPQHFL